MRDELPEELTRGVNGFVVFVSKAKYDRLAAALESISNGEGAGGLAETERLQEIARAALAGTAEHETLETAQRDNLKAEPAQETCPDCDGSGGVPIYHSDIEDWGAAMCSGCGGTGRHGGA